MRLMKPSSVIVLVLVVAVIVGAFSYNPDLAAFLILLLLLASAMKILRGRLRGPGELPAAGRFPAARKFCKSCNAVNKQEAVYCGQCGRAFAQVAR